MITFKIVGAGGGGGVFDRCSVCGVQATFFEELEDLDNPGSPYIKKFFCQDHRPSFVSAATCPSASIPNQYPGSDQRKYLPTLSDLVDRLSIVQMKAIFIPERAAEYAEERALIEHDIDLILKDCPPLNAVAIHAVLVIMLANRFIWENESKAREGSGEQDKLLKLTHSINGVRNTAKNQLASVAGGRKDYKVDALAAELTAEFGNWRIFE